MDEYALFVPGKGFVGKGFWEGPLSGYTSSVADACIFYGESRALRRAGELLEAGTVDAILLYQVYRTVRLRRCPS